MLCGIITDCYFLANENYKDLFEEDKNGIDVDYHTWYGMTLKEKYKIKVL